MPEIALSIGKYQLATPHLRAWERILAALDKDDYGHLAEAVTQALGTVPDDNATLPQEEKARLVSQVGSGLLRSCVPLLTRAPAAMLAFVEGCLRTPEGKAVALPDDVIPTLDDFAAVVDALIEHRLFDAVLAIAKKRLGLALKPATPQGVSDSGRA